MSTLSQLKGTIDQIATSTKSTASGLGQFKSKFTQQVSQVEAAIGGSAQGADKQFVSALQGAQKQVDAAVAALEQAARAAQTYGRSL
jgi:hypothetical protein